MIPVPGISILIYLFIILLSKLPVLLRLRLTAFVLNTTNLIGLRIVSCFLIIAISATILGCTLAVIKIGLDNNSLLLLVFGLYQDLKLVARASYETFGFLPPAE